MTTNTKLNQTGNLCCMLTSVFRSIWFWLWFRTCKQIISLFLFDLCTYLFILTMFWDHLNYRPSWNRPFLKILFSLMALLATDCFSFICYKMIKSTKLMDLLINLIKFPDLIDRNHTIQKDQKFRGVNWRKIMLRGPFQNDLTVEGSLIHFDLSFFL